MVCPICNTVLEDGTQFCTNCGSKVAVDESQTCTIKVTRLKKVFGALINFTLFVDGREIGTLTNGFSLECRVQPGVHKVTIRSLEVDEDQEVTLEDNQSVEISLKIGMGLVAGRPKIVEVKYY